MKTRFTFLLQANRNTWLAMIILVLGFSTLLTDELRAQETAEKIAPIKTVDSKSDSSSDEPVSKKVDPSITTKVNLDDVKPDASKAAKDAFNSAKEERLEDLRYKHLWIAYSLVWVIIFFFIRQTWQRSSQVAQRLDELKVRLSKLEDKQ